MSIVGGGVFCALTTSTALMVRSEASALLMPLKRVHSVRWRPRALDCAQCKESISLASSIGSRRALRIGGDKAAVNCSCKATTLAETDCRFCARQIAISLLACC